MNTPSRGHAAFFQAYEQALQSSQPDWGTIYHRSFLFGGPEGAQSVQLADFVKAIPHRAQFAQRLGLTGTKLVSVETSVLDGTYSLAKVAWQMTVTRSTGAIPLDASATYILRDDSEGTRIVAQLDHQDLMARIQALGD